MLVVGVIAAVIAGIILAFLHIGGGNGTPSSGGDIGTPAPATPCVLLYPNALNCASSDPEITLEFYFGNSTAGCMFSDKVNWGDGSEQTFSVTGGPAGAAFIGNHTYNYKGTFSITTMPTVTSGQCISSPTDFTFTLG